MDTKTFGALALQLLQQSQVPGSSLDAALEYRKIAESLASGENEIVTCKNSNKNNELDECTVN